MRAWRSAPCWQWEVAIVNRFHRRPGFAEEVDSLRVVSILLSANWCHLLPHAIGIRRVAVPSLNTIEEHPGSNPILGQLKTIRINEDVSDRFHHYLNSKKHYFLYSTNKELSKSRIHYTSQSTETTTVRRNKAQDRLQPSRVVEKTWLRITQQIKSD